MNWRRTYILKISLDRHKHCEMEAPVFASTRVYNFCMLRCNAAEKQAM